MSILYNAKLMDPERTSILNKLNKHIKYPERQKRILGIWASK
jgi:hypothetical protein